MKRAAGDVRTDRDALGTRIVLTVRRDAPLAILDTAIAFVAYLAPLVLRFDGRVPATHWTNFRSFLPIAVCAHLASNYSFGLYRQMWRYASVQEARRVILAGVCAAAGVLLADELLRSGTSRLLPFSVVILGAVLSLIGFGGVRFQSRLFAFRRRSVEEEPKRVLMVGAGDAGGAVLRDLRANPWLGLHPVAVVDDDPRKFGLCLHGVHVVGPRASIPNLARRFRVHEVLLAIPSARSELVREIAALCEEVGVTLRVLPTLRETVGGKVTAQDIRDLRIEDLLGRAQVHPDLDSVTELVRGRRVLITGAGGSIGSEIARQVASLDPAALVLLDHDETHLHDLISDLDPAHTVSPALAEIRDFDRLLSVFAGHRPEIVFHAAAHKHVPLLESHPGEALLTNVFGTANVADAAVAAGVERFVLISTDKAIRPQSVLGASKYLAEQIVRSVQGNGGVFCAVRFGNVLGSRGSVIPTFLRQIQRGGPITVTHPEMTRYFMSVREAVHLVLQAAALARGGEVFTLDMGPPVSILDLAGKLIRLSGRVADEDIAITIVGPRPGEKISEDIADPGEETLPRVHPAIMVARSPVPDRGALRQSLRELAELASQGDTAQLAERMKLLARSGPVGAEAPA